jgi:hypothetical protein
MPKSPLVYHPSIMRRLLWTAWVAGLLFFLTVLACLVIAGKALIGLGPRYANNELTLSPAPKRDFDEARIIVLGDTQKGIAAFGELIRQAKVTELDLVVHTGDLVSRADEGHYELAGLYVRRSLEYSKMVVTPGNHDIKGDEGLFQSHIGARQFAFHWGPVDIVIVDNATGPPDVAAVEMMLVQSTVPVLLFMHVPPIEAPAATYKPKPAYESFLKMIRKYPVVYVFTGHAHGYSRVEHDGVIFISNGVGGDSESWQFDQKAHLTIVEATRKGIVARELAIDPVFSLWANVEHLAIGHVREIVHRRAWGIPGLVILLLLLILGFRKLRKKKGKEAGGLKFTLAKTSEPPEVVL